MFSRSGRPADRRIAATVTTSDEPAWVKVLMTERDPDLVTSNLSRPCTKDGVTVELRIYRLDTPTDWSLEVLSAAGTSIA